MSLLRASARVAAPAAYTLRNTARGLHSTPAFNVKAGDEIPNLDVLVEGSPGNKVNLADEFKKVKKGLIVGVPGAFSGACSNTHVPSYIKHPRVKDFGQVFVVAVNDAFGSSCATHRASLPTRKEHEYKITNG